MTSRDNTTRADTTTHTSIIARSTPTRPPTVRRYPNNEKDMNAPLVPFIQRPGEDDKMTMTRRELVAFHIQLNHIERAVQSTDAQ